MVELHRWEGWREQGLLLGRDREVRQGWSFCQPDSQVLPVVPAPGGEVSCHAFCFCPNICRGKEKAGKSGLRAN